MSPKHLLSYGLLLLSLTACNSDESPAKDGVKPASATAAASSAASTGNKPQPPALHCAP
jgi:hypothetical protein